MRTTIYSLGDAQGEAWQAKVDMDAAVHAGPMTDAKWESMTQGARDAYAQLQKDWQAKLDAQKAPGGFTPPSSGMSTGTMIGIGAAVVGVVVLGVVLSRGRATNPRRRRLVTSARLV